MSDPYTVPIEVPQPSQLYIDGERLAAATEWFQFDDPTYDPIPVIEVEEGLAFTDGHTRAFLAHLAGVRDLRVRSDPDGDDLDLGLYRTCIEWCRAAGVTEIADLTGRVVSPATFEECWVARCQAAAGEVE